MTQDLGLMSHLHTACPVFPFWFPLVIAGSGYEVCLLTLDFPGFCAFLLN